MRRIAAVLSLILLAACGSPTPPSGGIGSSLAGREFVSDRVDGRALVPGTAITVRFESRALSASAGCNSMGGPYHLEDVRGERAVVVMDAPGLSMTEIGCDPARHAQDSWLADLILARPTLSLPDDRTMTLSGRTGEIRFVDRDVADPDRPLTGTTWTVDSIIAGDAVSSVPDTGKVTFVFRSDGTLTVTSDGCTGVTVPYRSSAGRITFGTYTVDTIGCPAPWAEALAVLDARTVTFAIEHARLTLMAADDTGLALSATET